MHQWMRGDSPSCSGLLCRRRSLCSFVAELGGGGGTKKGRSTKKGRRSKDLVAKFQGPGVRVEYKTARGKLPWQGVVKGPSNYLLLVKFWRQKFTKNKSEGGGVFEKSEKV
jgi:hypothetical protein